MIVLVLAEFYTSLEASMIYVALPTIATEYGDLKSVGWLISSYVLVLCMSAAICGRLGDIFGHRRLMIIVIAISGVGALISASADGIGVVIAGRALQGLCGAVLPLSIGYVRRVCPPEKRALYVGILTGAYSGGAAVGFPLGGMLVEFVSWKAIFWVPAGYSIVVVVLLRLFLPKLALIARTQKSLDVLGGILFAPSIGLMLFALTEARDWGWLSVRTLATFFAGVMLLTFWAVREIKHENPMIDVRALGTRSVAIGNFYSFLTGLGASQFPLLLNLMLQQPVATGIGAGLSAAVVGFMKIPSNLAGGVAAAFSGHLAGVRGGRFAAVCAAGVATSGWLCVIVWHDFIWVMGLTMIIASVGMAMMMAATSNIIVDVVQPDRSSEAMGLVMVTRAVGTAVGAQAIGVLLSMSLVQAPGGKLYPDEKAYLVAFAAGLTISVLTMISAFALSKRSREVQPQAQLSDV